MVAVLSPRALPEIRFTVDEYLQADLPEGQRYELVDGAVEMTSAPDGAHDEVLEALLDAVWAYRRRHPDSSSQPAGQTRPVATSSPPHLGTDTTHDGLMAPSKSPLHQGACTPTPRQGLGLDQHCHADVCGMALLPRRLGSGSEHASSGVGRLLYDRAW